MARKRTHGSDVSDDDSSYEHDGGERAQEQTPNKPQNKFTKEQAALLASQGVSGVSCHVFRWFALTF
jgi:hypothetical protein